MNDGPYVVIRDLLKDYIGRRVVDITQHDEAEFLETKEAYVMLMFDDGKTLRFDIGHDGTFHYQSVDGTPLAGGRSEGPRDGGDDADQSHDHD